jgi:transcriptional regulator with XRE-family HTH domain
METIQDRIRKNRILKGLKQHDIAKAIGVSRTAYVQVENGTTKSISLEMAIGIANALDLSFNELFEIPDRTDHLQKRITELEQDIVLLRNTAAKLSEEYHSRKELEVERLQFMEMELYVIELFELLDFTLFEKFHGRILAKLNKIETYSTDSVFWFLGEKKFKKLEEVENYLLPFLDIEKYAQSRILKDQLTFHSGSERWTKETLIERVNKAKKSLDL